MGYVMEVDLSRGAVAAMWRRADEGLQPVLQVAGVQRLPRRSPAAAAAVAEQCLLVLSDGVHAQRGFLATTLGHLVRDGALRRGAVIRVLEYVCSLIQNRRFIIVLRLEILQTERQLIGNPTIYEADATQPNILSSSGELGSHA
ncbi:hypothetical protein ACP70R_032118 [Stipagrostis hirtigluma subsp. patula]